MSDYLIEYVDQKREGAGMNKAQLLELIDIDFKTGYKYLSGERRLRRNAVLRIALVFNLSFEEVQDLFLKSFYPQLYIGDKRDEIIIEAINNQLSIENVNKKLEEKNLELI